MSFFHSTQANATPTASAARSAHPAKVQHSHRQHGQHPSAAHQHHGIHPLKIKTIPPQTFKEPEGSLNVKKQLGSDPNSFVPLLMTQRDFTKSFSSNILT
jgi:hypothetical protein